MTKEELLESLRKGRYPSSIPHSLIDVVVQYMKENGVLILNPHNDEDKEIILHDEIDRHETEEDIRSQIASEEEKRCDIEQEIQSQIWGEGSDHSDIEDEIRRQIRQEDDELSKISNDSESFDILTRNDFDGIFKDLFDYVENEDKIERIEEDRKQTLSVWQKILAGYIISNLSLVSRDNNLYEFRSSINNSSFKKGTRINIYKIENGVYSNSPCGQGVYWSEAKDTITLKLDGGVLSGKRYYIKEKKYISSEKIKSLLYSISQSFRSRIEDIMSRSKGQGELFKYSLIGDDGVIKIVSESEITLIQGPPGTGKTFQLAQLAKRYVSNGTVLVTAFTHTAINNALNEICNVSNGEVILKIGDDKDRSDIDKFKNYCRGSNELDDIIGLHNTIIGATVYEAYSGKLRDIEFDTVIIDESSQMQIHLCVLAMAKAKRVILLGDHKQLSPIVKGEYELEIFKGSFFEFLFGKYPSIFLNGTRRMIPTLTEFPSQKFYNSELISINNLEKEISLAGSSSGITWVSYFGTKKNCVRNQLEAEIVSRVLDELTGMDDVSFAVISPFRAQCRAIRRQVGFNNDLSIDTVDRIQGQQRDVIIYSLATNDPIYISDKGEFIFDIRRFNVAITRARYKVVIVADERLLGYSFKSIEGFDIFKEYLMRAHKVKL